MESHHSLRLRYHLQLQEGSSYSIVLYSFLNKSGPPHLPESTAALLLNGHGHVPAKSKRRRCKTPHVGTLSAHYNLGFKDVPARSGSGWRTATTHCLGIFTVANSVIVNCFACGHISLPGCNTKLHRNDVTSSEKFHAPGPPVGPSACWIGSLIYKCAYRVQWYEALRTCSRDRNTENEEAGRS